jgi:DNA-binding response OmpR family regulator
VKVLIADDDETIRALVSSVATSLGYETVNVANGAVAWERYQAERFPLAVLDIEMPDIDGLELCRRIRSIDTNRETFILVLTGRNASDDVGAVLEAGADDYMAKPFEMGELVARVRALVRRGAGRVSSVVAIGGLRLDTMRMSAVFNGAPARLSPLEFRLLDYLSHQGGRAVSAGELAEHLYGATEDGDTNAIEAIVARLRRKFGAGIIVTRRGFGYLLEATA